MGSLSDIDQEGFASAAFHAFPDMLKPDPITGDYGPNFFGHAWNTATYVVHDADLGWLAFGGNLKADGNTVKVTPLDSYRARVYIAPSGLWLTLESGQFKSVEIDAKTGGIRVGVAAADDYTTTARLRVEQPATVKGIGKYHPAQSLQSERDAYFVPLGKETMWINLTANP